LRFEKDENFILEWLAGQVEVDLKEWDIDVTAVVITRFENQPASIIFKNKLERRGIKVYTHSITKGYPTNVETIVSDEGYGANEYIKTEKPLVLTHFFTFENNCFNLSIIFY